MSSQDQELFKQLYLRYRPALISFAMSYLYNEAQAEEVVNDVFMGLWNKRETLDYTDELKSYMFTSVKNRSFNALRKNKQLSETAIEEWEIPAQFNDASHQLELMELQEQINFLIDALPPKCKQIFLMSRKEDMTYKQIAAVMEISPKTVENQIGNALKFLKKFLKR
ncbi:MAG: RNA polymerase sigma-70 factor [Bacteroidia bacterium]|nr:RNA polymerase sigma-70 factor [Bacteroidia bacterium]